MKRSIAALVVVSATCLVVVATSGASRAGELCPTFKQGSVTYRSQTVGTSWSCANAKSWIVKLIKDRAHVVSKNLPLKNGPRGLHCWAVAGSQGHATSGTCIAGTLAFPKSGFAWFSE